MGRGGRKLSYMATVQGKSNMLVGKVYTAQLGLKPGDEFKIKRVTNRSAWRRWGELAARRCGGW